MIPEDLKYTKEHEWVKIDQDKKEAIFGITDYAQEQLGDITFVELPRKDEDIKQNSTIATVESVKAASDIYAPISGVVLEINEDLIDAPELINQSVYEKGWICKVKISDDTDFSQLLGFAEYKCFLEESK